MSISSAQAQQRSNPLLKSLAAYIENAKQLKDGGHGDHRPTKIKLYILVSGRWSWFGTNMLGVGLHSYGFMDSAFFWLMAFNVSQVLVIVLAALPRGAGDSSAAGCKL